MIKLYRKALYAPLAQLDRASGYGPEGRGFESLRAYQIHGNSLNFRGFVFVFTTFSGSWILRWTVDPSRDAKGDHVVFLSVPDDLAQQLLGVSWAIQSAERWHVTED